MWCFKYDRKQQWQSHILANCRLFAEGKRGASFAEALPAHTHIVCHDNCKLFIASAFRQTHRARSHIYQKYISLISVARSILMNVLWSSATNASRCVNFIYFHVRMPHCIPARCINAFFLLRIYEILMYGHFSLFCLFVCWLVGLTRCRVFSLLTPYTAMHSFWLWMWCGDSEIPKYKWIA